MSLITKPLNVALKDHIMETNTGVQKLVSSRSIPLWINPNNGNFYASTPYKGGDIVILLSDLNQIYYLMRYYFESIAEHIGENSLFFSEKNNPELTDEMLNTLINGGYLKEDMYINPMTIVSKSEKGYGLYVSLKDENYDIPGASDAWFNLDMSETLESLQLQVSRIVSVLASESYINKIDGGPNETYNNFSTYLENRLDKHKVDYHFGEDSSFKSDDVEDAYETLDDLQAEIAKNENTTSSVMINPFIFNGEIAGRMMTIVQTTGQMFFYCMLDATKIKRDTNITVNFTPNNICDIIIPFVISTAGGIIEVENPNTDSYVELSDGRSAWYANSYVRISNEANVTNNITIETVDGFEDANFNNNFSGFIDSTYIATYTPIGSEFRSDNISIHGSPVKEISRTNKSLTIQLSSDYVWKYTGIAIALSGKYEVEQ